MNTLFLDRPVGQLVAEKPARSRVFERWGIDYCCGGKKNLGEVCAKKGLDTSAVVLDLETSDAAPQPAGTDWTQATLTALCDHIEGVHHGYLREALPRLSALTARVAERHHQKDPRLVELKQVYDAFRADIEVHTEKEDKLLFPTIRSLETDGQASPLAHRITEPIQHLLADHDDAGAAFEKMRALTDSFVPGADACNTHRAMLDALSELEVDMHQHVHKENNILFPRAIEKSSALG